MYLLSLVNLVWQLPLQPPSTARRGTTRKAQEGRSLPARIATPRLKGPRNDPWSAPRSIRPEKEVKMKTNSTSTEDCYYVFVNSGLN